MARGNFDKEIKQSIAEKGGGKDPGETPADRARDKQRGIKEGSPQDRRIDAANTPPRPPMQPMPPMAAAGPPSGGVGPVDHAAAIAHAILQHGRAGGAM
jgi:general stress protein YciG